MDVNIKDKIFDFAQCVVDNSSGKIRMVFNEEDKTDQEDKTAAHFLKYNDERLGRDLEIYAFMNEIMGTPMLLAYLLEEIILPIKKDDRSKISSDYLKEWGAEINKPENVNAWIALFQ